METIIEFLDTYNLPWLILAGITWLTIYFSCSLQQFFHALPVGLWTMTIGGTLENFFIDNKFWEQHFIMIQVGKLDLFVLVGPFFAVGLLLIRFLPKGRWQKFFMVLVFSALSTAIELIAIKFGFLTYHPENWSAISSLIAYYLGLMSGLGFYYVYYNKNISGSTYY
ncbi:hypothetical protein CACET_c11740 [Clostridium aceticum]|uniref:Uncharacterized protein n=1 Tax=Clostridium aceticum TaxID=84022 RepID=A0A0D8I888_9CLOT|nr:hypothetical protein [Clostridium aceticum]AKL94639.1 hypothetical protein CACET_c11740 [Clostridium aceticum]KJF26463.1 hypothetical protein TZ02_13100 [Clostridium aceticum]